MKNTKISLYLDFCLHDYQTRNRWGTNTYSIIIAGTAVEPADEVVRHVLFADLFHGFAVECD